MTVPSKHRAGTLTYRTTSGRRRVLSRFVAATRAGGAEVASADGSRLAWTPTVVRPGDTLVVSAAGLPARKIARLSLFGAVARGKVSGVGTLSLQVQTPILAAGPRAGSLTAGRVRLPLRVRVRPAPPRPPWPAPDPPSPPPVVPPPVIPPRDVEAPDTTITDAPPALTRETVARFAFGAEDAAARFECSLDDGPWDECASPHELTAAAGTRAFAVRAIDAAGNVDATPATRQWTIDTQAPTATLSPPATNPGPTYWRDGSVQIHATTSDTDVAKVEFFDSFRGTTRLRTDSSPPYTHAWNVDSTQTGRHVWTVKIYDATGNASVSSPLILDVSLASAAVETDPVPSARDAADDPAIWVHPTDPAMSTVIGTDKLGGLAVYDLSGKELHYYADSRPNNVDARPGFRLGDRTVDLVATSDRRDPNSIRVYSVDPSTRGLTLETAFEAGDDLYGVCMYRSRVADRAMYVLATFDDGSLRQWELQDDAGRISGRLVRGGSVSTFEVPGQLGGGEQVTEACVADDDLGHLYVSEENTAIWRFGAEPTDPGVAATEPVDRVVGAGGEHLVADIEGLAIYRGPGGDGFLVASSQGNETYSIYRRSGRNAWLATFGIGAFGPIDRVSMTDGIEVTSAPLGAAFPNGMLVAQDGFNSLAGGAQGNQNFKLVPWERIACGLTRLDPALCRG